MKTKEIDIDDEIDFSEKAFNRRFRRISRDELPAAVRKIINASPREMKSRITIYLDADIVIKFKEIAEANDIGYQTLINDALRKIVDGMAEEAAKTDLKEDLLQDKQFLRRLKAAITV